MNKKIIYVILSIFALSILGSIIYITIPKSYIAFSTAPNKVKVSIDNKSGSIRNGSKITVKPGEHKLVVYQDEFEQYETSIILAKNEDYNFTVALTPLTDTAKALLDNDESQTIIQNFIAPDIANNIAAIEEKYPILSDLPITARYYYIYSCTSQVNPDDITAIALCIDYKNVEEQNLRPYIANHLSSLGYNINDYETIWNNTN